MQSRTTSSQSRPMQKQRHRACPIFSVALYSSFDHWRIDCSTVLSFRAYSPLSVSSQRMAGSMWLLKRLWLLTLQFPCKSKQECTFVFFSTCAANTSWKLTDYQPQGCWYLLVFSLQKHVLCLKVDWSSYDCLDLALNFHNFSRGAFLSPHAHALADQTMSLDLLMPIAICRL